MKSLVTMPTITAKIILARSVCKTQVCAIVHLATLFHNLSRGSHHGQVWSARRACCVSGSGKIACKLWLPWSPVTHWWPELPANYGTRRQLEQYVQVVGHLSALVSFHVRSTVWSRRGTATGLPEFKKPPLHIGDGMNFLWKIAKMWAIPCTHCAMKLDFPLWQLRAYSPRESHLDRRQNLLKIDLSLWKIVRDIVIIVCQS